MRGSVPIWVPALLGIWLVMSCTILAQDNANEPTPDGIALQADNGLFAKERAQLQEASDRETRRAAFKAILAKATTLKAEPAPLVSILINKKPEETFIELLVYVTEIESARHQAFLPALILASADPDGHSAQALAAVKAYARDSLDTICRLLRGDDAAARLAAATICRERIGGLAGVARVAPVLVAAMETGDAELAGTARVSLEEITLLNLGADPKRWKKWLGKKTSADLVEEIGDRAIAALKKKERESEKLLDELLQVLKERMAKEEHDNAAALVARLKDSPYLPIRLEAARLLGELLPRLDEVAAAAPILALGEVLLDAGREDVLRIKTAAVLADSRKPEMVFPHIDRCLELNGISPELKLVLVKALNHPVAAPRLAALLKADVDQVETRNGLLVPLIQRAQSVVSRDGEASARDAILTQLGRLLVIAAGALAGDETSAPEKLRFVDLARSTTATLDSLARNRLVDVSICLTGLVEIAAGLSDASSGAVTAIKDALGVEEARERLIGRLTAPPAADKLRGLYDRLGAQDDRENLLINLITLYEKLGRVPADMAQAMRKRLVELAQSTNAELPPAPDEPKSRRDAIRTLLARLDRTEAEHAALIQELLDCPFGGNDALGYLQALAQPRIGVLAAALQSRIAADPVQIGLLVAALHENLTSSERGEALYVGFRDSLDKSVRNAIGRKIAEGIENGLDEKAQAELTDLASGPLRAQFVPACLEKLRANAAPGGKGRDAVSQVLLSRLKEAHPERYDGITLAGLSEVDFKSKLNSMSRLLADDGYKVP